MKRAFVIAVTVSGLCEVYSPRCRRAAAAAPSHRCPHFNVCEASIAGVLAP